MDEKELALNSKGKIAFRKHGCRCWNVIKVDVNVMRLEGVRSRETSGGLL
jgi:hypothetical protein